MRTIERDQIGLIFSTKLSEELCIVRRKMMRVEEKKSVNQNWYVELRRRYHSRAGLQGF